MEQQTTSSSLFQLSIDANNASTLRSAAGWAKILAVLGIIFGVLFIILGILFQNALSNVSGGYGYDDESRRSLGIVASGAMGVYILMGILTIIGSIFALNFGNKASTALRTNDSNTLRGSLAGLRNYFAFWAILMILGLLISILGIAMGGMKGM
ncbi:MAG: hypothetical protein C4308_07730 [Chitinophagaceae bacterium]